MKTFIHFSLTFLNRISKAVLPISLLFLIASASFAQWNIPPASSALTTYLGTNNATDLYFGTNGINRLKIFGTGSYPGAIKLTYPMISFGAANASLNYMNMGSLFFRTVSDPDAMTAQTTTMYLTVYRQVKVDKSSLKLR